MATFSKVMLSGDPVGDGILMEFGTSTTIHQTTTTEGVIDELWLYAVTYEFASNAGETNRLFIFSNVSNITGPAMSDVVLTAQTGLQLVVPGLPITRKADGTASTIKGELYGPSNGYVWLFGYVNRITP